MEKEDELPNLKSDLATLERKIQLTLEAGTEAARLTMPCKEEEGKAKFR